MRNSGHTEDEGADVPDARNTYNLNRSFGRDAISVFAETDVRLDMRWIRVRDVDQDQDSQCMGT